MKRKRIIIGNPAEINGITIIPIISLSAHCNILDRSLSFFGSINPQYIVIVNSDETKAFTTNGEDVSLGQLTKELPDLGLILDSTKEKK